MDEDPRRKAGRIVSWSSQNVQRNGITIDSPSSRLQGWAAYEWENIYHNGERLTLSSVVAKSIGQGRRIPESLPYDHVRALLDTIDKGLLIADRQGATLLLNTRAQKYLEECGKSEPGSFNFFTEILDVDPK